MDQLKAQIFKYRSYTPIPFLILMIIFQQPTILSIVAGLFIATLGEFIRFWGVSYAGSETRTTGTVGGSMLVISGPFAYVRNPLYVGNMMMYFGIGIMSMALFPYLPFGALIFFLIQYYLIIDGEENYLKNTYGKSYEEYFKNVPRFLPRLTPYKNDSLPQPILNIKAGLRSERRTLQAFSLVTLIIIITFLVKYI